MCRYGSTVGRTIGTAVATNLLHSGHGFIRSHEKRISFILYTFEVVSHFITSIALERHMNHIIANCWICMWWTTVLGMRHKSHLIALIFCRNQPTLPYLIPCPMFPIFYYYNWNILCFGTFVWNMWTTGTWIDSEKMSFWATFLTGSFSDPILTRFLNFVGEWKNCLLLVKSL